MNLSGKSLYVGMCCFRNEMQSTTCIGLMSTLQGCMENEIDMYMKFNHDCTIIELGKSLLVADFMRNQRQDYLLIADSDMTFSFNEIRRLMEHDVDVVSANYCSRSFPIRSLTVPDKGTGLTRCSWVPGGFLLLKRSALQKLEDHFIAKGLDPINLIPGMKYYQFFGSSIDKEKNLFLGEDYTFCNHLTDAGIEIHCDFSTRVGHAGNYLFMPDRQTSEMSRMTQHFPRR